MALLITAWLRRTLSRRVTASQYYAKIGRARISQREEITKTARILANSAMRAVMSTLVWSYAATLFVIAKIRHNTIQRYTPRFPRHLLLLSRSTGHLLTLSRIIGALFNGARRRAVTASYWRLARASQHTVGFGTVIRDDEPRH